MDILCEQSFLRGVDLRTELESTNDLALQVAADAALQTPYLILAERQTAGRGRGQNRWWSASGALTFSLVLEEPIVPSSQRDWPQISLAIAVAMCAALEDFLPGVNFGVKWPNDVHANDRKIAGILVEIPNTPDASARRVVVGIGLNVNNSWRAAPDEIQRVGVAMCDFENQVFNAQQVLLALLHQTESALAQLVTGDSRLSRSWQDLCVLRGRRVEVDLERELVEGVAAGINEEGALVVETTSGPRRLFGGVIKSISEE